MVQVTVHGRRSSWAGRTAEVSDAIHAAVVGTWGLPQAKRFHRFVLLGDDEMIAPGRGAGYLVVEVMCFTGRSPEAVERLLRALVDVAPALGLPVDDLEAVVMEVPPQRWAIRGRLGSELELDYRVDV